MKSVMASMVVAVMMGIGNGAVAALAGGAFADGKWLNSRPRQFQLGYTA
jgi:hypothetical protein